ncbi:MAG: hypothetical protein K5892_00020 [Acholeplasmatales bacterium]|nr:hypothetical protein [Acholeplasmatales bacterium]
MTELKKKTIIKKLNIDPNKRLIFVADIHGDINTFKEGLQRINFNSNDELFLIGDFTEKGDETYNLKTFRYIMELDKNFSNFHVLAGNCDEVLRFILPKDAKEKFLYFVNEHKRSILNDMAIEMNYPISYKMDVDDFVAKVQEKYKDLYEYMDNLADVMFLNDEIVLVHGGLDDIDNIPEYSLPMLKYDRFYELSPIQKKLMIVGHYPTRNYRADVASVNPIFDFRKKIISIDGGNHVCKGGQINFIILESLNTMNFSYIYVDHYEKYEMKEDVFYEKPKNRVNITFVDNEVELVDKDLDFSFIRHKKTNQFMWVHNSSLYQDKGTLKYYAYDATNEFLSLKKGSVISIIRRGEPYSIVKFDGYIGLIESRYLQ